MTGDNQTNKIADNALLMTWTVITSESSTNRTLGAGKGLARYVWELWSLGTGPRELFSSFEGIVSAPIFREIGPKTMA
jgi:hypothetical protein